jgi:hypothetical protein
MTLLLEKRSCHHKKHINSNPSLTLLRDCYIYWESGRKNGNHTHIQSETNQWNHQSIQKRELLLRGPDFSINGTSSDLVVLLN